MKTQCSQCHTFFKVEESEIGKSVECPKCKNVFTIDMPHIKVKSGNGGVESEKNKEKYSKEPIIDFTEMQEAADYYFVKKVLKWPVFWGVLFGVINILIGFNVIRDHPLNFIIVIIGFIILINSTWLISTPTPLGIITVGVTFIIAGIWNILITILNISANAQITSHGNTENFQRFFFWGFLGMLQIVWGLERLGKYSNDIKMPNLEPTDDIQKNINELTRKMQMANPTMDPNVVEFTTTTSFKRQKWKGKFEGKRAIFQDIKAGRLIFADREHVTCVRIRKLLLGETYQAKFQIGDLEMDGTIYILSLKKFEEWKAESV